jgi:Multicopper oxidase
MGRMIDCSRAFNSTLINGKGRYPDGPSDIPLAVVNVKKGTRSVFMSMFRLVRSEVLRCISYRFRLVSISCDPAFTFSIDNHDMTIIEVEGTNVQPLVVDSLNIFVGAGPSHDFSYHIYRRVDRSTLLRCCKMIMFSLFGGVRLTCI